MFSFGSPVVAAASAPAPVERKIAKPLTGVLGTPLKPNFLPRPLAVKQRGKGKKGAKSNRGLMLPPVIKVGIHPRQTLRFQCATTGITSITVGTIVAAAGYVVVTATTANCFFSTVKIRQVKIWTENATSTTDTLLEWKVPSIAGSFTTPDQVISEPTLGSAMVGYHTFVPPKQSPAAMWWSAASNPAIQLFGISCPVGSIVDLVADFTSGNYVASKQVTTVAASVGTVLYGGLDQVRTTTAAYVPVGLPSNP